MARPLDGVTVVELSKFVAGPAAGGILAMWGAEVIRIEPPGGDGFRDSIGMLIGSTDGDAFSASPSFYMDNHSKKSVILDVKEPLGMKALLTMLETADVFLSNLNLAALERLKLDPVAMRKRFPKLIVCPITAFGLDGDDRYLPGYDVGSFWARSSAAFSHSDVENKHPPVSAPAFGDHATAMSAVAGIVTALYNRMKTGQGDIVSTSLLRTGMYLNGWAISSRLAPRFKGRTARVNNRTKSANPLINKYIAKDGRAFWMLGYEADRHWPATLKALDLVHLNKDARFTTSGSRGKNRRELTAIFDNRFLEKSSSEWYDLFKLHGVWYQPVQSTDEIVHDPQAQPAFINVTPGKLDKSESKIRLVAPPVDFGSFKTQSVSAVPSPGEHTKEVLGRTNLSIDEVAELLSKL